MKRFLMLALSAAFALGAEEVKAPVTGAMIFKNGVSAVRRTVRPGKATAFDLACDLVPLQGSVWFTGQVASVVRKEVQRTEKPAFWPRHNITKSFAGKKVTLILSNGQNPEREVSGVVWDPDPEVGQARGTSYPYPYVQENSVWLRRQENGKEQFEMFARHRIVGLRVEGAPKKVPLPEKQNKRPVWHFTLSAPADSVLIDTLSRGLSWQSAYRIELAKNDKMKLFQDVEIVNNLADLENITLILASGFASFLTPEHTSPMAMIQPGSQNQPMVKYEGNGAFLNQMAAPAVGYMREDMAYRRKAAPSFGTFGAGTSEDISLLPLRNFSLKKGEVCHKVLGSAEGTVERLVHWEIASRTRRNNWNRGGQADAPEPMDALRFVNPFKTPITTSPLEIRDGGVVLAQVKIPWVNPGQKTVVDVTKALSIAGKVLEYDIPAKDISWAEKLFHSVERNRQGTVVGGWIAGRRYRITDVQGELKMKNYRKNPAKFLITLDYAGVFISAEENPKQEKRPRIGSINPESRLVWELTLPAGAEKTLKYRYSLLAEY